MSSQGRNSIGEARQDSQTLDPISQTILQRNHLASSNPSKSRQSNALGNRDLSPPGESPYATSSGQLSSETQTQSSDSALKPLRAGRSNRNSFLGRIVAPIKKQPSQLGQHIHGHDRHLGIYSEQALDTESQDLESPDLTVFSQPLGYVPQFPRPPRYVKVKSHGKKDKEFDRLFLAQELRGRTGAEIAQSGGRAMLTGAARPDGYDKKREDSAVWAMEFSKDGRYLAAGGKDYIVRVWAVLASKEDRQKHETEEEAPGLDPQHLHLHAPVFRRKTVHEYEGHTASILDLSWSKNNFLLSSSMDKSVRLWHATREECLCCFKHNDFVTSIQFHPRDDRFFLAGSLDSKLRLWSIPDKSVAYWVTLPDLITAVTFTPDGKTAIAGCLNGLCHFYATEGLKYTTQLHVRSAHGKNSKGSKITGLQSITNPPDRANGDVQVLITSNDSRIRVYNFHDKGLSVKLKGNANLNSQISASFSDDARHIICGSEDKRTYIWSMDNRDVDKDKRPAESFEAHQAIVTKALIAPLRSRQLLSASGDPIYDLCNPPPVTLVSRTHSRSSSLPQNSDDTRAQTSVPPTPSEPEVAKSNSRPEESPAYIARCSHHDGQIIVTADSDGHIKVFRQDCAYESRLRNIESTHISKRILGRNGSMAAKASGRSSQQNMMINGHAPVQNPSSDRILTWRQTIHGSNATGEHNRNNSAGYNSIRAGSATSIVDNKFRQPSPSYERNGALATSARPHSQPQPAVNGQEASRTTDKLASEVRNPALKSAAGAEAATASSGSNPTTPFSPAWDSNEDNPLMLQDGQSYMFWNREIYEARVAADQAANARQGTGLVQSTSGQTVHRIPRYDGAASTVEDAKPQDGQQHKETQQQRPLPVSQQSSYLAPPPLQREITAASRLTSEDEDETSRPPETDQSKAEKTGKASKGASREPAIEAAISSSNGAAIDSADGEMKCRKCRATVFRVRLVSGKQQLVCSTCGTTVT